MKRFFLPLFLAALLLLTALTACGGAPSPQESGDGLRIVTTVFPLYDWARTIRGTDDVTLLVDGGVDLHSYQPSVDDVLTISSCDLFIYVGGESDAWVTDALNSSPNPDRTVLCLLDILGDGAREEEITEGMEAEEESGGTSYDEHVWLSVKNARLFCAAIAETLADLDPDNAPAYAANAAAYDRELAALDDAFAAAAEAGPCDTLLFGDRFPFLYLVDDYGLHYYAAFAGCSAETEASFETIVFLAAKVDELGLPAVLTIEGSDGRVARTVAETAVSSPAVLTLNSMQSVSGDARAAGASYLSLMEENLAVLTQALGGS